MTVKLPPPQTTAPRSGHTTKALCAGLDPEWWTPTSQGARLAMRICGQCGGCPTTDPNPCGVIRQGIPYTDNGRTLPLCPNCGYPHTAYRGGTLTLCPRCRVPDVPIPEARGGRHAHIVALARRGLSDDVIAVEVGMTVKAVGKVRRRRGFLRKASRPRASRTDLVLAPVGGQTTEGEAA